MKFQFFVEEEKAGLRLDVYLFLHFSDRSSRSAIQKWIREGHVFVNGKPTTKTGYKIRPKEEIIVTIPPPKPLQKEPIPMEIPVLWEDEHYAIIHKYPGIATHPGIGDTSPALSQGLAGRFSQLSELGGQERPGIVHRLDKPTEGVLIIAKSNYAHFLISKKFQNREVEKTYYAWVHQAPPEEEGTIQLPIGRHPKERLKMTIRPDGRLGITHYKIEKVIRTLDGRKFSFLKIQLETGRTHQIRVHFQSLRCPIVGDLLYSRSGLEWEKYGLMLLAKKISFQHPITKQYVEAEIEFPNRFLDFEKKLSQKQTK